MIISVRGTSGSGKTHLARRLLEVFGSMEPIEIPDRKHPVGMRHRDLYVLGRYDVASGGADTLRPREFTFQLIGEWAQVGNVFFEGLLIGNEVSRTVVMARTHETHCIFLSTPLVTCVTAINERRALKGKEPYTPKCCEGDYNQAQRVRQRLRQAGVPTYHLDREAAFLKVRELLGV